MLKTKDNRDIAVEELNWNDVVNTIAATNPDLAKTMKFLNDDENYVFYKASYQFGDKIIKNGKCYLPLDGDGSIEFDDPELPDTLRANLSYVENEDPLGMILSKNSEFYLPGQELLYPQQIVQPGYMFGIPRAIEDNVSNTASSVLELTLHAGNRSLFMLPKISDQIGHNKIRDYYDTETLAPDSLQDHWALFVDIAKRSKSPWRCEVLYFPRAWINKLKSDEWAAVAKRLMMIHRGSYSLWHKVSDLWEKVFEEIENEKKLTSGYSAPALNNAKQLFMLAASIASGFKPATNDDSAPISLIADAYTTVYPKLTKQNQKAIIMEPAKFDMQDGNPIYHSINLSTKDLQASRKKSQISLLDEIRIVTEVYTKAILNDKSNVQSLYDIVKNTEFAFYHIDPANYPKILKAELLATEDLRFTNGDSSSFPVNSPFFKGCVKISRKI